MIGLALDGPWAGIAVVALGLMLLFASPEWLYRANRPTVARSPSSVPRWAKLFYRILGVLLLLLGGLLLTP